jgi:hypothetical protein
MRGKGRRPAGRISAAPRVVVGRRKVGGEAEVVGGAESGRETGRRTPLNCRARARVTQVGQPLSQESGE